MMEVTFDVLISDSDLGLGLFLMGGHFSIALSLVVPLLFLLLRVVCWDLCKFVYGEELLFLVSIHGPHDSSTTNYTG